MNRRYFLAAGLSALLLGCGPHHKSKPVPGLVPGATASEWLAPIGVGPYQVYIHKSWSFKQIQCLLAAIECHWAAWLGSKRATLRIGAHHWGRIWVYGQGQNALTPSGKPIWAPNSGPGQAIHVIVQDHRLHGLNHAIDFHQDPLLENGAVVPGREAEVELIDKAGVIDAYVRQQFLGCH